MDTPTATKHPPGASPELGAEGREVGKAPALRRPKRTSPSQEHAQSHSALPHPTLHTLLGLSEGSPSLPSDSELVQAHHLQCSTRRGLLHPCLLSITAIALACGESSLNIC